MTTRAVVLDARSAGDGTIPRARPAAVTPSRRDVRQMLLVASIVFGGTRSATAPVSCGRAALRGDAAGADASTSAAARATPATAVPEMVVLIACIGALLLLD